MTKGWTKSDWRAKPRVQMPDYPDGAALGAALAAWAWFVWDLLRGARVLRWLRTGDLSEVPAMRGIWGEAADRARRLLRRQETQIRDIQTQARADLKALHGADAMPMLHGMSLLSEAKPDAAAAEKARQQMLARHDKVSQRMLKAQLDIANVLTPAQRAQIATAMKARQERMSERMKERAERRAAHHAERAASMPAARPSAPR